VVKQTLPLIVVAALVLVKVLETIPKLLVVPRVGAVAAAAGSLAARATNAKTPRATEAPSRVRRNRGCARAMGLGASVQPLSEFIAVS